MIVIKSDGKGVYFTYDSTSDLWMADDLGANSLIKVYDTVSLHVGWEYRDSKSRVFRYDLNGKIVSITSLSGASHQFNYSASQIIVTHSLGDSVVYQMNASGRVIGFLDSDSNQYTYQYDAQGRLYELVFPGGGTREYHYENSQYPTALTGITDANGNRFATWVCDENGKPISSEHYGSADKVSIDYTYMNDLNSRVTVTNVLGKKTTYHLSVINGVRKVTQVEGHQSANCLAANKFYTYDTNGFVETKINWEGLITRYVRNAKGQELSRTEAEGTSDQRVIYSMWDVVLNLPAKITEPDREITFTYDANGNLTNKQVIDISGSP